MDLNRFVLMTLLEVVTALCYRLGYMDLFEQCQECRREVVAREADESKVR